MTDLELLDTIRAARLYRRRYHITLDSLMEVIDPDAAFQDIMERLSLVVAASTWCHACGQHYGPDDDRCLSELEETHDRCPGPNPFNLT